jgi:hypothetical protein
MTSVILLSLDKTEIFSFSTFGSLAKPAAVLLCVVSGALSFTSIVALVIDIFGAGRKRTLLQQRRELRKAEEEEGIIKNKQKVLDRIQYLSSDELQYLAGCLRENSQSFTTYVHSPSASILASKGMIYTPGGTHNQDNYPFVVNDFVWQYLLDNRGDVIAKDDENKRLEEEKKGSARNRRY